MNHFYTLKFQDLPELLSIAHELSLLDSDDDSIPDTYVCSSGSLQGQARLITDVSVQGTYDPETGNELTPSRPVPGVFVNLVLSRPILPSQLRRYRVGYGSAGECWTGSEPEPQAWPPAES
jgi:hypothetical protein